MSHQLAADVETVLALPAVPMILDVVCRTTGLRFAAVARVTEDRWVACQVKDDVGLGLHPGAELKVETTICNEIRSSNQAVVIDEVAKDPVFCGHPTPALYGFQSYVSAPIVRPDGQFFGTLCALDPRPARVSGYETVGMFKLFADLIAFHIDAYEKLSASAADLLDERRTAELREQFIAVLGHDLRNPLASIDAGTRLLVRSPDSTRRLAVLQAMQASVRRMTGLIENLMDFARGRLGGGLLLDTSLQALAPTIDEVVDELRASHPASEIETDLRVEGLLRFDPRRLAQLVSNLVGNALAHGDPAAPVRVSAVEEDGFIQLKVANKGQPIPDAARARLFQPFERGAAGPSQEGLGLGLFIASEIARAHSGDLSVSSDEQETVFTFRMLLVRT